MAAFTEAVVHTFPAKQFAKLFYSKMRIDHREKKHKGTPFLILPVCPFMKIPPFERINYCWRLMPASLSLCMALSKEALALI